jgi:uncharacterized protein YycO
MSIKVSKFPSLRAEDYRSVRARVQSGDILLCSGSGMFSKLIQRFTDSVWSHVGFVIRLDSIKRVMVLESVEPLGVRTVPLSHYVKDYKGDGKGYPGKILIARHDEFATIEPRQLNRMSRFAVDLFGYPYDKDEIAKIAARITTGKIPLIGKFFKERDLKPDREYICSEYAYECYQSVGIDIPHDKRGFVAPRDFARCRQVRAVANIKVKRR